MHQFRRTLPFSGDLNPANHPEYHQTLHFLPTLHSQIKEVFERKARLVHMMDRTEGSPPTNEGIISDTELQKYRKRLIDSLEEQFIISWSRKPIVIVEDSCFTNRLIEANLLRIFWEELYIRYVDIVEMDFTHEKEDVATYERIHSNAIIILWGSFSDAYTIDASFYKWKLAGIIRDNLIELPPENMNQRILGICFGQQFVANILGIMHKESPTVIATIKGSAQFMPSGCVMENLDYISPMFRNAFDGVSNFWTNTAFTSVFTRTGHVDFDLLDSKEKLLVTPIAKDILTGDTVAWWFRRFIGFQWHPEARFTEDEAILLDVMSGISPLLERDYGKEASQIVENFKVDPGLPSIKNIDQAFYIPVLTAMSEDMMANIRGHLDKKAMMQPNPGRGYDEILVSLLSTVQKRMDVIMEEIAPDIRKFHEEDRRNMLEKLDFIDKLWLNHAYDWKVNRGIEESSELLGFKDISAMIGEIFSLMDAGGNHGPYIFRDWGAGNGTLLKELYSSLKWRDIVFYGVGDTIYFDLYQGLLKFRDQYPDIPEEVLILFTQKVIERYNDLENDTLHSYHARENASPRWGHLYSKVWYILQDMELSPDDSIFFASMFSGGTTMFPKENIKPLSEEARQYILTNQEGIRLLKKRIVKRFYEFFEGFFERIYISDFSGFTLEDPELLLADVQLSMRSTSHLDNREYVKVLTEYILHHSRRGSILFENGVHRSYSSVPRIAELHFLAQNFQLEEIVIHLVYDTKTNYFCTAIILKDSDIPLSFLNSHISEGKVLVPIQEAAESTFFRFEAFLRNFLVASFRDFDIFFHFNKDIIKLLQRSIAWIENKETDLIFDEIVRLVNSIVRYYQEQGKNYDLIDTDALLLFQGVNGEHIYDIINQEVIIHDWFNRNGVRRN